MSSFQRFDWKIMLALALGLPGTILGTFILTQNLVEQGVMNDTVALILLVAVTLNCFYLMFRLLSKNKTKK